MWNWGKICIFCDFCNFFSKSVFFTLFFVGKQLLFKHKIHINAMSWMLGLNKNSL